MPDPNDTDSGQPQEQPAAPLPEKPEAPDILRIQAGHITGDRLPPLPFPIPPGEIELP
jgi:hypothetical protein